MKKSNLRLQNKNIEVLFNDDIPGKVSITIEDKKHTNDLIEFMVNELTYSFSTKMKTDILDD